MSFSESPFSSAELHESGFISYVMACALLRGFGSRHRARRAERGHPTESNYLLNPLHRDFRRIRVGNSERFETDLPRHGVPRTSVYDLHWLASIEHLLHFLYAHAGQVAELLLRQRPRRRDFGCILVAAFCHLPVDVFYERIDVCPRVRAKVEVVRVLVHIEREDGNAARDARRVL